MHTWQAAELNYVALHNNRIIQHDAVIVQDALSKELAQAADAWRMAFNTKVVVLRIGGGNHRLGFTHAEANFKNLQRLATKYRVEVMRCRNRAHRFCTIISSW